MTDALQYYRTTKMDAPKTLYRPDIEMEEAKTVTELGNVLRSLVQFYDRNGGANQLDMLVNQSVVQSQPYYASALENCGRVLGKENTTVHDFYTVAFGMNKPLFQ